MTTRGMEVAWNHRQFNDPQSLDYLEVRLGGLATYAPGNQFIRGSKKHNPHAHIVVQNYNVNGYKGSEITIVTPYPNSNPAEQPSERARQFTLGVTYIYSLTRSAFLLQTIHHNRHRQIPRKGIQSGRPRLDN